MRVTFLGLGFEQLAISQLSAVAKNAGHDVRLAFSASLFNDRYNLSVPRLAPFFDDRKDLIHAIQAQQPEVLACSVITGTYQWMLGIAKEAKAMFPHLKVIFGGVHTSAVPQRVLAQPQVDYVIVGEGDLCFPMIVEAIGRCDFSTPIPNTRFKSPLGEVIEGPPTGFIQDLDSLPFFDKVIWEDVIDIGDLYMTMASRGCPYRCTFCFNNFFANLAKGSKGRYVRQRSVDHMMFELRQAKRRYRLKMVDFQDDVFTVDKKWMKKFFYEYKRDIGVPFQCLTHPRYMDEEVACWLHEAGCIAVQMGIQTMDDEYKFQTIKRYEKAVHVHQAFESMQKYGLKVRCDHMFGLPGEPLQAQELALQLFKRYPPYRIHTYWTNFLPGTEMVHQALKMGLITPEEVERLNEGLDFDFFRTTYVLQDPQKTKYFKNFEVVFKLIPLLPRSWRQKIHPRILQFLPTSLCNLIIFLTDMLFGLLTFNAAHINYARHYLYHLKRFFLKKLTLPVSPATRLKKREPFVYHLPISQKPERPQEDQEAREAVSVGNA